MSNKTSLKQKFFRSILGGALIAGLLPLTASAALPAFPTSGSCGMLVTMVAPVGATPPFVKTFNILGVLNFTSATGGTVDYNFANINYDATSPGIGMSTPAGAPHANAIPFTVASMGASGPTGAKIIAFPDPAAPTYSMNINAIAVNGGNTLLLQGGYGSQFQFSGVCQF
jgi:hypothetical protein